MVANQRSLYLCSSCSWLVSHVCQLLSSECHFCPPTLARPQDLEGSPSCPSLGGALLTTFTVPCPPPPRSPAQPSPPPTPSCACVSRSQPPPDSHTPVRDVLGLAELKYTRLEYTMATWRQPWGWRASGSSEEPCSQRSFLGDAT